MRLNIQDTDNRLKVKLSRVQGTRDSLMTYGDNDDYPEVIERLIKSSATAESAAGMLARFLAGDGFSSEINNVEVGKDEKGQPITARDILEHAVKSIAYYNGYYLRVLYDASLDVNNLSPLPFKQMRFSKPDETGYSAWVYLKKKADRNKKLIKYGNYSTYENVLLAQLNAGASGQCFFSFFDKEYFYPLSVFDSVYMDLDTEFQISVYRNNEIRNGFRPKTFIGYANPNTDEEREEYDEAITKMMGPDGNSILTYAADIGSDGALKQGIRIDQTKSEFTTDFTKEWEPALESKIRRAAMNIPQILIDFEKRGGLGNTSGEAFREAVNIYNAVTRSTRNKIAQSLGGIFARMPQFAGTPAESFTINELVL